MGLTSWIKKKLFPPPTSQASVPPAALPWATSMESAQASGKPVLAIYVKKGCGACSDTLAALARDWNKLAGKVAIYKEEQTASGNAKIIPIVKTFNPRLELGSPLIVVWNGRVPVAATCRHRNDVANWTLGVM